MRKLFKLAAGALVLSLAVTGCGSPAPDNSTSGKTDSNAAAGKPYKLKLVYRAAPQKDTQAVQEAVNKYLEPKINATVEIQQIDLGQWNDKTNLMIASREPVDVIFTAQAIGYATNVGKGAFLALNDDNLTVNGKKIGNLLQQYGKGITDSLDPLFLKGSQIDGKNFGVPTNKELASQGGYVFRKDLAEKLGILDQVKNIKSNDDLEALLKIVKEKMPDITPLYLANGITAPRTAEDWDYMGDRKVPGVIRKTGKETKVLSQYDTPEYVKEVTLARKLMLAGVINKDAATTTVDVLSALKSGKVFMIPALLKPGKADELAIAYNMQGMLEQVAVTKKTLSTSETTGAILAISSTSGDPVKAMQFINLLHTDKTLNNLINFGSEGVHYTKVSDNVIKSTDKTSDYNTGTAWELGNQFLNYVWSTEDPNKWDKFKQFNTDVTQSPALGFTFDVSPVSTEVAAIANLSKQYDTSIETGSVDPEKILPEYKEKLKAAGLDKLIAEKQKQLDAYLAKQK
ncbi:ABC transporter substrate-binding protein [Paenibacillus thalictri]|uniref:DUF3502 domain-containing protein n=1 Tax=Paenibacillus thalictri TaxID=2527873 RepID=A0A4Q9DQZ4_9BACL|nr:ABC transporter substrate-binding protein [Paenibacillus thalictri]TBL76571.1 DUF3502 domain-containing protein [Paenibacillus thalictri]